MRVYRFIKRLAIQLLALIFLCEFLIYYIVIFQVCGVNKCRISTDESLVTF